MKQKPKVNDDTVDLNDIDLDNLPEGWSKKADNRPASYCQWVK